MPKNMKQKSPIATDIAKHRGKLTADYLGLGRQLCVCFPKAPEGAQPRCEQPFATKRPRGSQHPPKLFRRKGKALTGGMRHRGAFTRSNSALVAADHVHSSSSDSSSDPSASNAARMAAFFWATVALRSARFFLCCGFLGSYLSCFSVFTNSGSSRIFSNASV